MTYVETVHFFVRTYEFHQNCPLSLFMKSRAVLDFSCVKTVGALPTSFTHLDSASLSTALSASSSLALLFHCASLCRRSPREGTLTPASLCHIFPLLLGSTSLDRNHRVSSGNATGATASEPSSGTSSAAAVPLLLPCASFKRRKTGVSVCHYCNKQFLHYANLLNHICSHTALFGWHLAFCRLYTIICK